MRELILIISMIVLFLAVEKASGHKTPKKFKTVCVTSTAINHGIGYTLNKCK